METSISSGKTPDTDFDFFVVGAKANRLKECRLSISEKDSIARPDLKEKGAPFERNAFSLIR
jgi:hypothetical protein